MVSAQHPPGAFADQHERAGAAGLLRHRLFDIDIIIRRTLVYSLLTVTLALLYFAAIILLQQLLCPFVFQGQNQVVVSLATLAIAALFRPLRRHLQEAIDRRFYRRRYDSEKVLAAFSAGVRDETDLDRLAAQLAATVLETVQPAHASVWLIESDGNARRPAAAGAPFEAVMVHSRRVGASR
jgi:hypothetical protein